MVMVTGFTQITAFSQSEQRASVPPSIFENPFDKSIDLALDTVDFTPEARDLINQIRDISAKIKEQEAAFNTLRAQALEQRYQIFSTLSASGNKAGFSGLLDVSEQAITLAKQISGDLSSSAFSSFSSTRFNTEF